MMPTPAPTSTTGPITVRGRVEAIYFGSPTFSAGRLLASDGRHVNFAGPLMVEVHDPVVLTGAWTVDPKYGAQVRVSTFTFDQELDGAGLAHFLANHVEMRGIGPVKAERIALEFGKDFDRVIEHEPQRVAAVAKLSTEVVEQLRTVWLRHRAFNSTATWLASFGLTHHQITSLIDKFGNSTVALLKNDPYLLADEVPGFGFRRVDVVARKLGAAKEDPARIRAGIVACVTEQVDEGDCWVDYMELIELANKLLVLDTTDSRELIEEQLDELFDASRLVCESVGGRLLVALPDLWQMERDIADILRHEVAPNPHDEKADLRRLALLSSKNLNRGQREALYAVAAHNLVIVSGQAGSGKTYLVSTICDIYARNGKTVVLAAPTGKAAKRIEQVVGQRAQTLHRLLGFNSREYTLGPRSPGTPARRFIDADVVIVDEVSMVDVPLAWQLLGAIDFQRTSVVLIGDHNQLPPVGPGNLLRDLVDRRAIPTVVLDQVVRQAGILKANSNAILAGEVRKTAPRDDAGRSPWIVVNKHTEAAKVLEYLLWLFESVIHEHLHFDLLRDVQLLTPQRKGPLGADELNMALQRLLQKKLFGIDVPPVTAGKRPALLVHDRVLQTRNNYDLQVMNGAVGIVTDVGPKAGQLTVRFDDRSVDYSPARSSSGELQLAYATSIHKCVAGDTLIATDRGLRPIRELAAGVPPGRFVSAAHRVAGRRGWAVTDQVYAGGIEPTLRVTTRAGFTIEGSHRHPVLVATEEGLYEWRRLPELRTGDVLILRRGVNAAGAYVSTKDFTPDLTFHHRAVGTIPPHINEELGWLLGALVGDGNQTDRDDGRVEFTKNNDGLLIQVISTASRLLGARPTLRRQPGGHAPSVYFHGRAVRQFLEWAGLGYAKAPDKCVPWSILASPSSVQRAFLRGLFDTDGGVSQLVHFSTTSAQLASEVQQLLLNTGLIAKRYCMRPAVPERGWSAAYRIEVMGDDIRLFRGAIGFSHNEKADKLLLQRPEDERLQSSKSNWGSLPHGRDLAVRLRDELRQRGGRNYDEADRIGGLLSRVANGTCGLNTQHLHVLNTSISKLSDLGPAGAEVAMIVRDGLFFDPISTIEPSQAEVFDVHVPDGHSFIGNGFVNHNSQGSEFPCAVVVAHKSHSYMHHRNLLYTAVTRASQVAIIIGDAWGIRECATKIQVQNRRTFLSVVDLPPPRPLPAPPTGWPASHILAATGPSYWPGPL
jgi:exodeoxyribonuclease V alpha subunit